jgi:hypothetical protein
MLLELTVRRFVRASAVARILRAPGLREAVRHLEQEVALAQAHRRRPRGVRWDVRRVRDSVTCRVA